MFTSLENAKIQKATRVLMGPARQKLEVLGQIYGYFSCKTKPCQDIVFIVKGMNANLFRLPTIMALNLITRVNEISDYNLDIPSRFPKPFQGLGIM